MFCVKNSWVCLQEVPAGRHSFVSDENGAGRDLYVCWDEVQTVRDAAASWTQEELHQPCSWTLFCLDLWPPGWRNTPALMSRWMSGVCLWEARRSNLSRFASGTHVGAEILCHNIMTTCHSCLPLFCCWDRTGLWVLTVLCQLNWSPLPPGVSAGSVQDFSQRGPGGGQRFIQTWTFSAVTPTE